MENLTLAAYQQAAPVGNPGTGELELKHTPNPLPLPGSNGEGQAANEAFMPTAAPPTPVSTTETDSTPGAQHAAPAKAPIKTTKKPHINPENYRKAKAPAAEEAFSDGAQTTVPVRKPGSRNFFRAHPDEGYRLFDVPCLEDDNHEWHIIAPELEIPEELERFIYHLNLITCINHKGTLFLWAYKNSTNDWSKSAGRVVRRAIDEWVRLSPDMDANGYRIETAPLALRETEPIWPKMTFDEILNTAFENKSIDSLNHPIIRSLQGLA